MPSSQNNVKTKFLCRRGGAKCKTARDCCVLSLSVRIRSYCAKEFAWQTVINSHWVGHGKTRQKGKKKGLSSSFSFSKKIGASAKVGTCIEGIRIKFGDLG